MEQSKTILLTGGHAGATAYALVQALKKNKTYSWKIHFIGAKSAIEGKNVVPYEKEVLPILGVTYHAINAGRLQRRFSFNTVPSLFRIPVGLVEAFGLVRAINPDIVLSFGGYVGFPVVIAAKLLGKKVIIHEQTVVYGRANKASAIFADKIAIAKKTSEKYFDSRKTILVGNPISSEILGVKKKEKMGSPQVIFITGASRGAQVLNEVLSIILPKLLRKYKIVHQAGNPELEKYKKVKENLGTLGKNYEVYGVLLPNLWSKKMDEADVIIGRSGANMVAELMVVKRPAILIPIPWTFADEQNKNAQVAKEFGIARILPQGKLTPENLLAEIELVVKNWKKMVKDTRIKVSPDINASKALVDLIISELK